MEFFIVLFFMCVGGMTLIGKLLGRRFSSRSRDGISYIDKSVHHHYHDNRSIHVDGKDFKNLK